MTPSQKITGNLENLEKELMDYVQSYLTLKGERLEGMVFHEVDTPEPIGIALTDEQEFELETAEEIVKYVFLAAGVPTIATEGVKMGEPYCYLMEQISVKDKIQVLQILESI